MEKDSNKEESNAKYFIFALFFNIFVAFLLLLVASDLFAENLEALNRKLYEAVARGKFELVIELIEKGADMNAEHNDGWTPLMVAAKNGHKEICEFLISKDANVNAKNNKMGTALLYAVIEGHIEICKLLILKGADVNAKNNEGQTALNIAEEKNHLDVINYLKSIKRRN